MTRLARLVVAVPIAALCVQAGRTVAAPGLTTASQGPAPVVVQLRIAGAIDPVMAEYIAGGIAQANDANAALILVAIDTPGGLDTAMRDIVQRIIDSRVPVAAYVAPSAARAASAGFFVLLAADIAAMAPGTHTGAASPLAAIGGVPLRLDDTLRRKIVNDATAYLRSYAGRRGRNTALAESAITEGKAFTEREALDGRLIDLVADSTAALLRQIDGRDVARFNGTTTPLRLREAILQDVAMSARQRFLARVVQPDVFFILLLVGVLGLYTEFTHPGLFAPGAIGGICLVLALFAMHLLPINFTGVLLVLLAVALFILEAKFPTHGILGVGGVVSMLLGALMLVRSPLTGAGVSLGVALGATIPFAVLAVGLMRLVLRSRTWVPQSGVEELARATGEVTEAIGAAGSPGLVRVRGELWRAVADAPIAAGTRVRVTAVNGLTLRVAPAEPAPPGLQNPRNDERSA